MCLVWRSKDGNQATSLFSFEALRQRQICPVAGVRLQLVTVGPDAVKQLVPFIELGTRVKWTGEGRRGQGRLHPNRLRIS